MRRRVVKVGGSLLASAELPERLVRWQENGRPASDWVLFGGGRVIDAMRDLDRRFALDTVAMHWRCIRLLRATWEVAAEWFPEWERIDEEAAFLRAAAAPDRPGARLVAVDSFYTPATTEPPQLPANWTTTTDAIAAHLAHRIAADELVLLKACAVPEGAALAELAGAGIIDAATPAVAAGLKVRVERLP